ncbi:rho GTPase-activating protein 12 isoform X2 [Anguilla rostrata]|uniref:rho GTPase-activating protein 12 isoform X2 n=1 Tax=Anguilla rostrata TaxID=7938 RepID=UPI0030CB1360
MMAASGKGLVLVEFEYEYTNRDGSVVSIKPNERYMLLEKTNDHWWHVCKDKRARPFYIPAKYVKELPSDFPSPLDFLHPAAPEPAVSKRPADSAEEGPCEVTIRVHSPRRRKKKENRMSTFGVPLEVHDPVQKRGGVPDPPHSREGSKNAKRSSAAPAELLVPQSPEDDLPPSLLKSKVPSFSPADPVIRPTQAKPVETPTVKDLEVRELVEHPKPPVEFDDPPRPDSDLSQDSENIYETISDIQGLRLQDSPVTETAPPLSPAPTPVLVPVPIPDPPPSLPPLPPLPPVSQLEKTNPDTALYVNISELKKSAPRLAPPSSSSPAAPRHLSTDSEEWEVHTDQESGKEFYYNPTSGQSTWDNPRSPFMEPDSPPVVLSSPSPSSSPPSTAPATSPGPVRSPGPAPTPGLTPAPAPGSAPAPGPTPTPTPGPTPAPGPAPAVGGSDWEKLLDEASGSHYFYNHVSGETSWGPPGLESPPPGPTKPPGLTEPPQDGPPPLPDEDYPVEDEERSKTPPKTFPKDFTYPPLKRSVIPRVSLETKSPAGWTRSMDPDGKMVFTSEHTQEQWIKSMDDKGQAYYYLNDGSRSQWNLPEIASCPRPTPPTHTPPHPTPPQLSVTASSPPKVGNGVDSEGVSVLKNWRQSGSSSSFTPSPFSPPKEELKFFPSHMRNISDQGSDASSAGNSPELLHQVDRFKHRRSPSNQSSDSQQHAQTLEKAGILNKTKIAENGKRLRKNWAQSWTVLHGGILTFHKDPKFMPGGNPNRTNQIVPEFTVELRGANVNWASKDKSSKKHVLELKTRHGSEYLVQYDTESIINDWHKVIVETIRQLDHEHHSEEENDEEEKSPSPTDDKEKRRANRPSTSSNSGETDQGRVRTKLRKFLQRRPTLQSVKEKGYIRDNVFGCNLDVLCSRENTAIPRFVEKCIKAVERRGLSVDGIYRVSGNLATIQKLRHKADHEENLDLDDGQWEEIHVVTGALKLFLRELPEPLFPYSFFDRFIAAIKVPDKRQKVSFIQDLVKILPLPNLETMKALFKHLRKVIEHHEENRMSEQSVAIVFGPTLLRPETESSNMTMHMVFQSQIVELILHEYDQIFGPN